MSLLIFYRETKSRLTIRTLKTGTILTASSTSTFDAHYLRKRHLTIKGENRTTGFI